MKLREGLLTALVLDDEDHRNNDDDVQHYRRVPGAEDPDGAGGAEVREQDLQPGTHARHEDHEAR